MSTVTKAISSVEFHVNARQANAALQSIQEEAKRCRLQVEELQEQAAKGVTTVKVDGMDVDIQKRIREVKALQKTWESAAQSQIKGAKAFDELWKNARMGTIESMTGAQIKSGINASKPIYDRLRLGDAEDRMKAQAIKDMQDQGQKVLNQLKTTTDQIIKQIADGETIAADVLEREARNLKSIMDLLPPLSQEWKDYNLQYQAINQQIERQTVLERQLRGEIVTREDAIRVINAANREATQQEIVQEEQRAKAAREAAEAKASEADQYRTTVEQKQSEIFATNDLIAAKRREIDTHHESAAAAKEAADKARDAAYKDRKQAEQEARNQQDAYNKQKKIRDDAAKDVEKFRKELEKLGPVEQKETQNTEELTRLQEAYNQKVERRKQLEQELEAIKVRSLEDDPHIKQLREEISTLDELIAVSDKYRKQFAKMSDTAFEKGYMGKTGLEDERTSVFRAEDYLKRAYRDKMKAGVADMNPDDPEYQDAAKRVAGGIVQNAQENLRRAIFNEIKGGELSSKALEEKIETYRNMMGQAAREAYSLKDDPEYNTYKYIIAQMEKYLDLARQVEAERQKIAGNEPFMKATQSDVLNDVFGDSLIRQRDKRVFDELTTGRPFREKQEQDEATAKRELKKAQDEENESLGRLNKAKKESAEQTAASNEQDEKRAGVQQKLADAETRLADENRKLNEQADKTITANQQATQAANDHQQSVKALGDVMEENRKTGQRLGEEMGQLNKQQKQQTEELADASEKMTDAEKESNRHIKTEQEARLRIQQLNNQSIEQLTASLRVLEEENRRINDPGNQRWQENERYIGQLTLRLEELKKQSAELRREPVLDMMTQRMDQLGTLSRDALTETKKFWQAMYDGAENDADKLREIEDNLKRINTEEQKRDRKTLEERAARLQQVDNYSVGELREGIDAAKRLQDQYHLTDDELQQLSVNIVAAETRIAKVGVEAERQAQKQREQIELMQQQLANGSALTESALKAQVNYWQRLADDPKAAAEAVKQYTANMERAQSLLDVKDRVDIRIKAGRLDNMDGYSVSELREGIDAAKKMQDTFRLSNDEVQQLSEKIVSAEVRISQFSVESERQAQRQREQIALMEQQLANGSALTESALKAQVNYWQRLADDPKAAAEAVAQYTANMKQAQDLLDQSQRTDIESKAGRLQNLGAYSVSEIREGIDAAKKMQDTFHLTDAEVQQLSEDIVAAEKHVSQFSVENERAAQKQREQVATMEQQLQGMTNQMAQHNSVSVNALKAQHSYWQKLIDDPKTATENLQQYQDNLAETERLQRRMVGKQGQEALDWFRGGMDADASANDIKERAAAMKEWRDTLPKESQADVIAEIDGYLKAAGVSAKKAAEDVMDLKEALDLAEKAGNSKQPFNYSAQEIQAATKALELRREELIKQIRAERDLGNAVDAQEKELDDLTKKLRSLKFEQDNVNMSQEKMRTLIETPANAVNLDELRAAIKRADGQLRQMEQSLGQNSSEYKRFAEQVRQAKNVMKEMEGQAKASATAWEKAFNRLKTYVVMYMGFNEVWQKMSNTARDLMDLSDRMGEVRKTTGFTADEVGRLSENLKKMDVRTSLTSLMEISASAGQLGLKTLEDVQGFTEAANKLMIALPEMGREAATEMMRVAIATGEVDKIRKQLQEGTIEGSSATAVAMEKIASTIDRLRASSASTAPEITDFVKRVGAVGAQSGITIDQVAALGSTVSSLGMRIEMSATALSRMIPAIRNNAFELAKAIGVTPDTIRNLFDTGRGMEVILMILQRIKDTGMDADSVEQMLGMAGMRDIMKDLNQQGARAGIVFSGLSQNVDELRRQLGVAGEAYEENIAIQQEFDKMNETTAAKWERLKNAFEEMFVGDEAQRGLGVLIDMLRGAVDIINDLQGYIVRIGIAFAAWKAGVGGAIWTYLINPIRLALTGVHSLDFQVKGLAATWRTAWKSMDAATKTNWIFAIISAVVMLGKHIYDTATRISELQQELNRLDNETDDAVRHVGRLVTSFNEASVKANAANKKEAELREQTEKLSKEVDKLKKSTDDGTASTDELKKKQAELEEKEKQLKKATDESNKANKERSNLISEMNSKYSTYLGYMLNEKTAAEQVASAHQLIIAALKEERKQKGLNALHDAVDKEYADDIKEYSEDSQSNLKDIPRGAQRRILDQWRRVLTAATIDADKGEFRLSGVNGVTKGGTYRSEEDLKKAMRSALREIIKTEAADVSGNVKVSTWAGKGIKSVDTFLNDIWGNSIDDGFGDWAETYISRERDIAQATHDNQVEVNQAHQETVQAAVADINSNMEALRKTSAKNNKFTDDQIRSMAQNVNALVAGYERHSEDMADSERNRIFGEGNETTLQNAVNNVLANLDQNTRARVFRVAQRGKRTGTGDVDTNITNPWGTSERADSTTYTEMTAEQLVNRREQMNKFVNSLQTDTDVKAVLNEDKALKKAIEAGMSSDMRTVIEWYNTERLKIQDELHARHLTNTGDWLDPKKERGAKKQFRDEMDAYLHELDAYYTERKTRIEQARNDEEITEGEAWRRTIQNDNEWQTRRAELQKLYSRKQQEVTKEELDAIIRIIAERTGDSESFVKAAIAKTNQFVDAIEKSGDKGAAIVHRWMSQVVLDTERSYLKAAQAIGKQMKFIEDTLAKERPYDGITKNLQDNLDKMGVLAAKYRRENEELARQGKEPKYSNEQITAQSYDEMAFYLRQAADAYSIDIDELLRRMAKEGMTATAEEISKSDMLKQAVMGQLRKTYQEVQDAVKKEASQIKKDVEIIWNDDARGIGGMSMKATFDKALAQLGMQQDSVSRANSLIGAGAASDNVASRLAMKQIEVQMRMQKAQYDMYRVQANQRMAALKAEAEEHRRLAKQMEKENHLAESKRELLMATNAERDAENVRLSLGLTLAEETKKEEQQKAELLKIQEESQNRLYTSLREWADLLTSSLQGVFEASHAGDAEYYNERAKLDLTGKGGPGSGTYVVIDDAGTSDATAHYEYLDERQALERQHEIEVQNAQAEAWKKLWDDINMKMSEQITDWMNAYLQNASVDANTQAVLANTQALYTVAGALGGAAGGEMQDMGVGEDGVPNALRRPEEGGGETPAWKAPWQMTDEELEKNRENMGLMWQSYTEQGTAAMAQMGEQVAEMPGAVTPPWQMSEEAMSAGMENITTPWAAYAQASTDATETVLHNQQMVQQGEQQTDKKIATGAQSAFAKMTAAANLYGIAYQAMSNDNLSTEQKFQMIAVQAAGQAAISALTATMAASTASVGAQAPAVASRTFLELGPIAGPAAFAAITALLGGLLGLAVSKIAKGKSEIAQATGASVGAGRLATGMLTYAEGNVNELTDPASLTPGRQYNVDGADGKTYRARYMGKGAKTHITNGPEFHLVGEAGREAIIDAKTTRLLQMNETGIWRDIQTLYNGGSISGLSIRRRRGTGVTAFADGNIGEFEDALGGEAPSTGAGGMSIEMLASLQASIDRQSDLLENALVNGIKAVNKWTGSDGIPAMYNKMQKEAQRHGEKYL